jgi:hypothetical protein
MSTRGGEGTTEAITGTDTHGIIRGSITASFKGTGKAGTITGIGKSRKPGEFRVTNLDQPSSNRH